MSRRKFMTEGEVFENTYLSKTFTKNDCPGVSQGTSYTYEVPAGKYTAKTQEQADALAQAEIDAYGQSAANDNGTCSLPVRIYNYTGKTCTGTWKNSSGNTISTFTVTTGHQYVNAPTDAVKLDFSDIASPPSTQWQQMKITPGYSDTVTYSRSDAYACWGLVLNDNYVSFNVDIYYYKKAMPTTTSYDLTYNKVISLDYSSELIRTDTSRIYNFNMMNETCQSSMFKFEEITGKFRINRYDCPDTPLGTYTYTHTKEVDGLTMYVKFIITYVER